MQRLADQLIGDVGAIEIAGIDVVHPARNSLPEHGQRCGLVPGGTEHTRPCQLHGAVTKTPDCSVAEGEIA
ncbi:hypothetical protein D9M73_86260 [compost metagenome]